MIKVHNVEQGTDEWLELRRGIVTASEVKHLVTPTLKTAKNDKSRTYAWELLGQRVTGHIEPVYVSDHMLRGSFDEEIARELYNDNYGEVEQAGFITNHEHGPRIGYSPDGLVGDSGLIEIKSRLQKHQMKTIIEGGVPSEYMAQIQTGLLVTGRDWCDFVSYCGGMPFYVCRVEPDAGWFDAIVEAVTALEAWLRGMSEIYAIRTAEMVPTERIDHVVDLEVKL